MIKPFWVHPARPEELDPAQAQAQLETQAQDVVRPLREPPPPVRRLGRDGVLTQLGAEYVGRGRRGALVVAVGDVPIQEPVP